MHPLLKQLEWRLRGKLFGYQFDQHVPERLAFRIQAKFNWRLQRGFRWFERPHKEIREL